MFLHVLTTKGYLQAKYFLRYPLYCTALHTLSTVPLSTSLFINFLYIECPFFISSLLRLLSVKNNVCLLVWFCPNLFWLCCLYVPEYYWQRVPCSRFLKKMCCLKRELCLKHVKNIEYILWRVRVAPLILLSSGSLESIYWILNTCIYTWLPLLQDCRSCNTVLRLG
jgi:hypothetical protein